MKKLFYVGLLALVLFELANVYFIMPLPYSQRIRSIDVAYFLHEWRWWFRGVLGVAILAGAVGAFATPGWRRWLAIPALAAAGCVAYAANFVMAADRIFLAPNHVVAWRRVDKNTVEPRRLVVGVEIGGEARAYPVQFIGYHHQVRDTVGGMPVLVSYCTVCRTGRVFSPIVDGKSGERSASSAWITSTRCSRTRRRAAGGARPPARRSRARARERARRDPEPAGHAGAVARAASAGRSSCSPTPRSRRSTPRASTTRRVRAARRSPAPTRLVARQGVGRRHRR